MSRRPERRATTFVLVIGVLLVGACSSSSKHRSSVPTTTSGTAGPMNLTATAAVKAGLVTAFETGQHLAPAYVAGTRAGTVFYAFDPSTRTYWAVGDFAPTEAAMQADERLQGAQGDPLIQFQDGPWVFSRTGSTAWTLRGDTGGLLCPPRPPASVLALWGNRGQGCP